jgi:hypothetical protein
MIVTACRSCSAKILWVETEKGKRMPLDAQPSPKGTFELRTEGPFTRPNGTRIESGVPLAVYDPDANEERYESHFSTCPDRKTWRK